MQADRALRDRRSWYQNRLAQERQPAARTDVGHLRTKSDTSAVHDMAVGAPRAAFEQALASLRIARNRPLGDPRQRPYIRDNVGGFGLVDPSARHRGAWNAVEHNADQLALLGGTLESTTEQRGAFPSIAREPVAAGAVRGEELLTVFLGAFYRGIAVLGHQRCGTQGEEARKGRNTSDAPVHISRLPPRRSRLPSRGTPSPSAACRPLWLRQCPGRAPSRSVERPR